MKIVVAFFFPLFMFSQYKNGKVLITAVHKKDYEKICQTMVFKQITKTYKNDTVFSKQVWLKHLEYPDKLRIDMGDTTKGNYSIFKNDSAYNYRNKKLISNKRNSNSLMLLLGDLYYRPLQEVLARIQKLGIKLESMCTQKYGTIECYVVGVQNAGETPPQVWINNTTLQVERFIGLQRICYGCESTRANACM